MSKGDKLLIGFMCAFSIVLLFGHIFPYGLISGSTAVSETRPRLLPDHSISPGWVNSDITQANIGQTICNPKWSTSSIRPPSSYTTKLKKQQISWYGYADTDTAHYEEDHIISLELGGHPTDQRNLWPEAYPEARYKDKVENYLHARVCMGSMTLAEAQKEISGDWTKVMMQKSGMVFGSVGISESDD